MGREMDRRFWDVCGSADVVPDRSGEERLDPQGGALDLPAGRHSDPHLWSWALGGDQNDKVARYKQPNEVPPVSGGA